MDGQLAFTRSVRVVERLDRRQLLLVLLHQVGQPGRKHFRETKIVD